eukprot:CAMPEP_0172450408 /NCGR_PEP_ID=MMETSP1065-20121228/8757_1 /TAXON_ID=265537 /ORGANISM="Amphiprora paludosa, Strain CCMP125" /LENGTH=911 /DNA_ID=CAMNT_0013202189 /DNA_START=79 /DNA_END=2814 /DNA_ORIENTATION=-
MAAPYATSAPPVPAWQPEMRSVTPAASNARQQPQPGMMNNSRYASAPRMGGHAGALPGANDAYAPTRSITPNRMMGVYNRQDEGGTIGGSLAASGSQAISPTQSSGPSSTGLIRLSLKKPMGIVFEPMYDPNQPSAQRGVRICDLPRTGAAALSRKLQVGDELLQINDKTVSRLSFDEIMDFIIDADPESVNLLFRRPRKETLQARQGVQQKLNAAANKDNPSTVKWMDEASGAAPPEKKKPPKETRKERKKEKKSKRSKRGSVSEEEETFQSSVGGDDSYAPKNRRGRKGRSKKNPYETESFLDLLIDTICSNSGAFRKNDDYLSDEESSGSESKDEDTYVTYEESVDIKKEKKKSSKKDDRGSYDDEEDEEESEVPRRDARKKEIPERFESMPERKSNKYEEKKFEDETIETHERDMDRMPRIHERPQEREREVIPPDEPSPVHVPLGLAPNPPPVMEAPLQMPQDFVEDEGAPGAPIREFEFDDRIDHGADVSVMESLGGPSLLIEKQRAAQAPVHKPPSSTVPQDIMAEYGLDYPTEFGKTREETIQADPLRFYTYVVKSLLEQHEPEKVRLLDKLLAKYKGREDHLVQKLSVRYNRPGEEATPSIPEEKDEAAFSAAVQKSKLSPVAAAAVNTARERMQEPPEEDEDPDGGFVASWPEKEQKEPEDEEPEDNHMEEPPMEEDEERSESGSEYSRDSVDGTSPAVIAQVSELLNYVYGKTSVPGQIDRVSTIMRAYEGREAVLLELLETKALIKANKEKENADDLPAFLRNSPQTQQFEDAGETKGEAATPMSSAQVGGAIINDDISSMSGVSSPTTERQEREPMGSFNMPTHMESVDDDPFFSPKSGRPDASPMSENFNGAKGKSLPPTATPTPDKKKKKGIFGGLFGKKKGKDTKGKRSKVDGSI